MGSGLQAIFIRMHGLRMILMNLIQMGINVLGHQPVSHFTSQICFDSCVVRTQHTCMLQIMLKLRIWSPNVCLLPYPLPRLPPPTKLLQRNDFIVFVISIVIFVVVLLLLSSCYFFSHQVPIVLLKMIIDGSPCAAIQ